MITYLLLYIIFNCGMAFNMFISNDETTYKDWFYYLVFIPLFGLPFVIIIYLIFNE